jgi:retron-type reverse transcriptase
MDQFGDRYTLVRELTDAFLIAPWTTEHLIERGAARLGSTPAWLPRLAWHVTAVFSGAPLPRRRELVRVIGAFLEHEPPRPRPVERPPAPEPAPAARHRRVSAPPDLEDWRLPAIASVGELAERLELSVGQLEWLADVRSLERSVAREQLRNYRYLALPRRGAMPRVVEAPKLRLKEVQRWILREILGAVPPHPAVHGFVPGRSVVSHAQRHIGQPAVLRLDLKDFFASVPAARLYRIWRLLGYPRAVAHVLTGLTTNCVPAAVWQEILARTPADAIQSRFWLGRQLATPHLPQGAPTSPALANLAAFGLDRRLSGLAAATRLRYSRYADDLVFSGASRLMRNRDEFEALVATIVDEQRFQLNEKKSVTHPAGGRQTVCGVVVNVRTNLRRSEYDRLRAILHNAASQGPGSQNRDHVEDFRAHLLGRIAWVEALNPGRARRLRELYAAIDWS